MLTRKQLVRFVKIRSKSEFQSNLQFQFDAEAAGFKVRALGDVLPFVLDGVKGYRWKPKLADGGEANLVEFCGLIYLEGDAKPETKEMFERMPFAKYLPREEHAQ